MTPARPLSSNQFLHLAAQSGFSFLMSSVSENHYLQDLLSEIAFAEQDGLESREARPRVQHSGLDRTF